MKRNYWSGRVMHQHTLTDGRITEVRPFIMPWCKWVRWCARRKWNALKRKFTKPVPPPVAIERKPFAPVFRPSQDDVATSFLRAVGRKDEWMPMSAAIEGVERLDDIERIGLWSDWMIDQAIWCSMPVIQDGHADRLLWKSFAPRMTLAEFFAPREDKYNDPNLSAAHQYYQLARS